MAKDNAVIRPDGRHVCGKCGKSFSRQDKLKTHMDRHIVRETPPGAVPALTVGKRKKASPSKKAAAAAAAAAATAAFPSLEDMGMLRPHPQIQPAAPEPPQNPAWNNSAFPGFNPYAAAAAAGAE